MFILALQKFRKVEVSWVWAKVSPKVSYMQIWPT